MFMELWELLKDHDGDFIKQILTILAEIEINTKINTLYQVLDLIDEIKKSEKGALDNIESVLSNLIDNLEDHQQFVLEEEPFIKYFKNILKTSLK